MTDKPLTIEQFVLEAGFTPPTDSTVPDPHIVELIQVWDSMRMRQKAARQWQPIETAPKDGTFVLVWMKYALPGKDRGRITVAQYQMEYQHPDPSESLRWKEQAGLYNITATHWMPLPEPPVLRDNANEYRTSDE